MPIMPAYNQKQGCLGSPLHNNMLLYAYVDVFSLYSQNSTLGTRQSSEIDFNLRLISGTYLGNRTSFRSDAGTWRWRSVFGGYKLLRWFGISRMGKLVSGLI